MEEQKTITETEQTANRPTTPAVENIQGIEEVKEEDNNFNIAKITKERATIFDLVKAIIAQESITIKGNKYIRKDGWRAIAGACGVFPEIIEVREIVRDGNFKGFNAVAILKDIKGNVISRAEGFCGMDERFSEEYAVRAMSQTRAINRVCSNGLSFIVVGTGYKTTPAEEMNEKYASNQKPTPEKTLEQKQLDFFLAKNKNYPNLKKATKEVWDKLKPNGGKMTKETIKQARPFIFEWCKKVKQEQEAKNQDDPFGDESKMVSDEEFAKGYN